MNLIAPSRTETPVPPAGNPVDALRKANVVPGRRMLELQEVLSRLGVSKSKFYVMQKSEPLLQAVRVGGRSVRYPSDRIDSFLQKLVDQAGVQGSLQ